MSFNYRLIPTAPASLLLAALALAACSGSKTPASPPPPGPEKRCEAAILRHSHSNSDADQDAYLAACEKLDPGAIRRRCKGGSGLACYIEAMYLELASGAKAAEASRRACSLDYLPACFALGTSGGKARLEEAAARLGPACDAGDTQACAYLGQLWQGSSATRSRAVKPLRLACAAGLDNPCTQLADLLLKTMSYREPFKPEEMAALFKAACARGARGACAVKLDQLEQASLERRCYLPAHGRVLDASACVQLARSQVSTPRRAYNWLEEVCRQGYRQPKEVGAVPARCREESRSDPAAAFVLGCRAGQAETCGMDAVAAWSLKQAQKDCSKKNGQACDRAAEYLYRGVGVKVDPAAAVVLAGQACAAFRRSSCATLQAMYADETLVLKPAQGVSPADPDRTIVTVLRESLQSPGGGLSALSGDGKRLAILDWVTDLSGRADPFLSILSATSRKELKQLKLPGTNGEGKRKKSKAARRAMVSRVEKLLVSGKYRLMSTLGRPGEKGTKSAMVLVLPHSTGDTRRLLVRDRGPGKVRWTRRIPASISGKSGLKDCGHQALNNAQGHYDLTTGLVLISVVYDAAPDWCEPTTVHYTARLNRE